MRTGALTIHDNAGDGTDQVMLSGTGVGYVGTTVTLSASTVTFGNQKVGAASSPLTVTLTNSGSAKLVVASVVTSGDFSQTDNCGAPVPPRGKCVISDIFGPTREGTRTGSHTITDNAAGRAQIVNLTGFGKN